jgi:hypothetical protein
MSYQQKNISKWKSKKQVLNGFLHMHKLIAIYKQAALKY